MRNITILVVMVVLAAGLFAQSPQHAGSSSKEHENPPPPVPARPSATVRTLPQPLAVPYYAQYGTQWCWATSMSMILKYYGIDYRPWKIAADFGYGPGGYPSSLDYIVGDLACPVFYSFECYLDEHFPGGSADAWVGRTYGTVDFALQLRAQLEASLSAGNPVWLGSYKAKHAVVVTGYDAEHVYVNDPSGVLFGAGGCCSNGSCDCVDHAFAWNDFFWTLIDVWQLVDLDVFTINLDPAASLTESVSKATIRLCLETVIGGIGGSSPVATCHDSSRPTFRSACRCGDTL